jgi:carbon-monoxide dehydrogenase medium subunit/xanthine dehydrogenase FAD-binding subunit
MQHFEFYGPSSLDDALTYISEHAGRCKIIAGGTDLIPALRNEGIHPDFVLSILEIKALRGITETHKQIRIGPTTTFTEIAESPVIQLCLRLLADAASWVGGPQIRNRGTIGGNIATASPAADVLPAVIALDGELELRSKNAGIRTIRLVDAIKAPYITCFHPDEIMTGILLKKLPEGTQCGFEKLGRRNAMARARMNMSVVFRKNQDGIVSDLRVVPGAVTPVATRMTKTEQVLLAQKPEESLIERAAGTLAQEMVEITGVRWSTEYKMPVVQNVFKRVLRQLI